MLPFYPDLQWPRPLFSNNQIRSLKLKHFWKHSSFNPSLSSQLACQAKWWSTALQPEPTNRCGRVISFINLQFKYVHDTLRDRPLFSLGGVRNIEKNCLQVLKRQNKLFANVIG